MGLKRIGSLWRGKKSVASGRIYYPPARVVVMANNDRNKGRGAPDFYLCVAEEDEKGQGQQQSQGGGFGGGQQPQPQGGPGSDYPQSWDTGEGGGGSEGGGGGWA